MRIKRLDLRPEKGYVALRFFEFGAYSVNRSVCSYVKSAAFAKKAICPFTHIGFPIKSQFL